MSAVTNPGTIKRAAEGFSADGVLTLAAALAFYLVLSLAPLVLVTVTIVGLVWGQQAAGQDVAQEIQRIAGPQAAQTVQGVIANMQKPSRGRTALVIGALTALFAATGVFVQLQSAMDTIWNVKPDPNRGFIRAFVVDRFLSLLMVLLIGLLFLAALVASAVLSAISSHLAQVLPVPKWGWQALDFGLSLVIVTLLFALLFKLLPHVRIPWREVWLGAFITAILFVLGKFFIGLYLAYADVGSAYGAAGSLVLLLVFVYYSSIIVFFGAEWIQAHAENTGQNIQPSAGAVPQSPGKIVT